ncbi:AraC family transcriptional regulator [Paenibacillus sp. GCM10027626]|uniref:AraC family transcriptional regulator n=1 Tax=Paenibacillus sp. GCM10027626 TaxID=3273411 RepID=UPI00362695DD
MLEPDLAALRPEDTLDRLDDYHFPPYITLAHIFNAPSGWGFSGRVLEQYAINYVLDGAGEFTINGSSTLVEKGDVFFYGPGERHGLGTVPGRDFLSITIVFHWSGSPFPFDRLMRQEHLLGNYSGHPVEAHFSELTAKYGQPGLHHGLACQGLLLQILSHTCAEGRQQHLRQGNLRPNVSKLVQVKNHIADHPERALDSAELERLSGLSWNYLITSFNRAFGVTPAQFLIWVRIRKAKELALQTPLSFGEIAERVGYHDVHTFGKLFKKKTGMSLSAFCSSVCRADYEIDWPGKGQRSRKS